VIVFARNVASRGQLRTLTNLLQHSPRPPGLHAPLLIMVDQEGGDIRRIPGPPRASAEQLGAKGLAAARRAGRATGCNLAAVGINVDLAPVADIALPSSAIGAEHRAFADSPSSVARLSGAFAAGLDQAGVAATAKHFPGLGRALVNTDQGPVIITAPASALAQDLLPFRSLVDRGVQLVMLSTATYPAMSNTPAALSHRVVTRLLRGHLHFHGVVITDDLQGSAVSGLNAPARLAEQATKAGADLLLFAKSYSAGAEAARGLLHLIRHDPAARARAEQAATRILRLRRTLGATGMTTLACGQ
jgi:beta-N-acetylhexosaminidase